VSVPGPSYTVSICNQSSGMQVRGRSSNRQPLRLGLSIALSALAGCSVYPIPDNVMSINTEDIVLHARCEMRSALIDWIIKEKIIASSATEEEVIAFAKATQDKVNAWKAINAKHAPNKPPIDIDKRLSPSERKIRKYIEVAVAYTFDFNITENNKSGADVAFKLPFVSPKVFDLDSSASLNLKRQGQRVFKASDRWAGLIIRADRCKDVLPRRRNIAYPLDGSIGVDRVVKTFINLYEQGGAKDSLVDTLIFTTEVSGDLNAGIKLSAVPHSFRLISAGANFSASRLDIHKMTISLVFPHADSIEAITGVERYDGYLNAPFDRPAVWRARYNLCVADAREREDAFQTLRHTAPEVYCIEYADAFAPEYGPPGAGQQKGGQSRAKTVPTDEKKRPNFFKVY
jgi:hypothetical protein